MLDLLPSIAGDVTITRTIQRECTDHGAPSELRAWIAAPPAWLSIVDDPASLLPETSVLDPGEAGAITLAWLEWPESLLILDEKRGRAVVAALGLPMIGVLAIVTRAAMRGEVDFETAVERLKAAGFHLSAELIKQARDKVAAAAGSDG